MILKTLFHHQGDKVDTNNLHKNFDQALSILQTQRSNIGLPYNIIKINIDIDAIIFHHKEASCIE